jgi:hydroxymethylbilane synthase
MAAGRVVIGTRGSALARWQAQHIAEALKQAHPGLEVVEEIIVTTGDREQTGMLAGGKMLGGKGLWVEEIERALTERRVDLAVHSLKDVPSALAPGLVLTAVPPRADPRDVLVSRSGAPLAALPAGARIGTSSLRRVCQLRVARPDVATEILRGNVDTRLRKVAEGQVDAAVLAAAGLDRLGHGARITERFPIEVMLPAIGQGALALEIREDDERLRGLCQPLGDEAAGAAVAAERALLASLEAGCRTPVAGHARVDGGRMVVEGLVGRPDGSEILRERVEGAVGDAASLGRILGDRLLAKGARELLAQYG